MKSFKSNYLPVALFWIIPPLDWPGFWGKVSFVERGGALEKTVIQVID